MQVLVRHLEESDLPEADRIYRLAFGTQYGLADPLQFRGDAQVLRGRWAAYPEACFVAQADGALVASVTAMLWGSVFILGPLTVLPDYWGRSIARSLIPPVLAVADSRPTRLAGLYTWAQSPKHLHLYESHGFTAQYLTAVMSKPVAEPAAAPGAALFSALSATERRSRLEECREIADAVYPGLDLSRDIEATAAQRAGDTLLLADGSRIAGFAVCHFGPGSEAGSGLLYVKFAAVRPDAAADFERLVGGCEGLASEYGASRIAAGVNSGRRDAYRRMKLRGYRADLVGVAMQRPDQAGYNHTRIYALDDWR